MSKVVLGDVLIEQRKSVGAPDGRGLPLIGVSNKEGLILSTQKRLPDLSRYKLLQEQWFAYNPMRINVGSIGFADKPEKTGLISPDYVVFSCSEAILPAYFFHFIKSDLGLLEISRNTGGSVRERLYFKNLAKIEIELPSIEEQRQIVAFLNKTKAAATAIADECQQALEQDLPQLRQAILQQAVEGKLTENWRRQHPATEPASELLQRIRQEKVRLVKEGKIKKEKPLEPVSADEVPYELPEGWVWCRLSDLGIVNPRNSIGDDLEISFVPMPLVSEKFGIMPTSESKTWGEVKSGFTHFAENDVAVAKITPCFENSKACIFKNLKNGFGAGTTELHVFRSVTQDVLPEFIYFIFKSPSFLSEGKCNMRGAAGQKRVPTEFVKLYQLAIPPLEEQHVIVSRVKILMAHCDELEQQIEKQKAEAERLMQALVQEALKAKEQPVVV